MCIQISGCSPKPHRVLKDFIIQNEDLGPKVLTTLKLLDDPDESEMQRTLSVIDDRPRTLEEALAWPEDRVLVTHGCTVGGNFNFGMLIINTGGQWSGIVVYEGTTFFVITSMLPILDAATGGRVTPYRLWRLALSRGRFRDNRYHAIKGVDYGPVEKCWWYDPPLFGELEKDDIIGLEDRDTPEDIADLLRAAGYWMWMRPDRFPLTATQDSTRASHLPATLTALAPADSDSTLGLISRLPIELLLSICLELPLSDVVAVAAANKTLYVQLLGSLEARDALGKAYICSHAR
ncbi:hypothetical protein FRC07_005975, partial [Ceratobasidium sp. 392]